MLSAAFLLYLTTLHYSLPYYFASRLVHYSLPFTLPRGFFCSLPSRFCLGLTLPQPLFCLAAARFDFLPFSAAKVQHFRYIYK